MLLTPHPDAVVRECGAGMAFMERPKAICICWHISRVETAYVLFFFLSPKAGSISE